jgi:DNA polymerase-3 subunit epsilon
MREIVLDTETTGLDPRSGDRLVEIGCIELDNKFPTGRSYHVYINPDRAMPREAFEVHGLSDAFLADKPRFEDVVDEFLAFIGDARLVIHNAQFDMGFINSELKRTGRTTLADDRAIDTVQIARRKHPGSPANLDALCARYGIDAARRVKHGALLDAELLAEVYIELNGGRQADLGLGGTATAPSPRGITAIARVVRPRPDPLPARLTQADIDAHAAFVATLGDGAVWLRYRDQAEDGRESA